jgi:translation initiation factor 2B subunit (eIF-2B alpha/beta/delta family)
MADLVAELDRRIAQLAADRESGASELLDQAIRIVADARAADVATGPVVRALCRAQPTMASFWTLAMEALASDQRFEQFVQRVQRAPQALARFAVECFANDGGDGPLRLVTLSRSRSVLTVFEALHLGREIRVSCAESRPGLEGRALASQLASSGVGVTLLSDAAIAHAVSAADAVVVGADAVGPEWFLNKSGTRMLAAAAAQQGVPVYVAATRDKFVGAAIGGRLVLREGAPAEIWDAAPAGVDVRNPYFEATPLDMVTSVISDIGVLGTGMIADVCEAAADVAAVRTLLEGFL